MKWFRKTIVIIVVLLTLATTDFYMEREVVNMKIKEELILETGSKMPRLEDFVETWGEIGDDIEISYYNKNNNELQLITIYKDNQGKEVSYEEATFKGKLRDSYQKEDVLMGIGTYSVMIKDEREEYQSELIIEDKIAPVVVGKDIEIEEGEIVTPDLFISSCTDNSHEICHYYFVDKDGKEIETINVSVGKQEISIIAKDASNNSSEIVKVNLVVNKQIIPIENKKENDTSSLDNLPSLSNKENIEEIQYCEDTFVTFSSDANEMLEYVNSYRIEVGVNELILSEKLNQAAMLRASELASIFSHTRPNNSFWVTVLTELSIPYSLAAENVSYGYGSSLDSTEKAAKAFRNSEEHYQNMISSSYHYMGIGKYEQNGSTYWVILFTS